ncbi:MAG: HAMP domain-containing sensor histidine kinase [Candidatus Omnitrophota bacterium]|nr:HAMP domain-containing sensor histidine kinase [Candidatus Omnitrophota bacterium]
MRESSVKPHFLGIFFILAVILPSIILSLIAVRSINREEAYVEKQLERSLLAEVVHVSSLANAQLKDIQKELNKIGDIPENGDYQEYILRLQGSFPLIGATFLLSSNYEVVWPNPASITREQESSFLESNKSFLADKTATPVYKNIALAYKDVIMKESKKIVSPQRQAAERENLQGSDYKYSERAENSLSSEESSSGYEAVTDQQSQSSFDQYDSVRKKVYDVAKEKGQQVLSRTISFSTKSAAKEPDLQEGSSILVSESLKLSQIVTKATSGFIPRFVDDKLNLLFWKKDKSGYIIVCLIDKTKLKERILEVLPNIYSSARILTVLDENGSPLVTPIESKTRDWRRPFVAREVSEILPRWEIAAYLSNPSEVSLRARLTAFVMAMFIVILFASVAVGGILVLRSLNSELTLAQQKTTFVANVSHELKTPLTSIRMFSEMLKEKRQPDEQKREKYLDIMASETERLTRLINNVLDFSRMTQGKIKYNMKAIDIVSLSMNLFESQKLRLENNEYEVNFKKDIEHLEIRADEEAIKQAILNLISNAEKYCSQSKEIDFEVTRMDKFAIVNIKDRGIGIPPKDVKKIFKAFYRVDDTLTSKVRGTGLGLTIARQIIRDHGGDIEYFARDGGGSIFQIKLPI